MDLQVRRVVTGHDEQGRAVVTIDGPAPTEARRREGHASCLVWTTEGFPVDNGGDADPAGAAIATTVEDGTVFRVVRYGIGVAPRMHRTESVDYAVVMSGEIDMELDDGVVVHLRAGDVLVQRGTMHGWVNHGPDPCVIAFVLISADPVVAGERVLTAEG